MGKARRVQGDDSVGGGGGGGGGGGLSSQAVRAAAVVLLAAVLATVLVSPLALERVQRWVARQVAGEDPLLAVSEAAIARLNVTEKIAFLANVLNGTASVWSAGDLYGMCQQAHGTDCVHELMRAAERLVNGGEPLLAHRLYDTLFTLTGGREKSLNYVLAVRSSIALMFGGESARAAEILQYFVNEESALVPHMYAEALARSGQCDDSYAARRGAGAAYPVHSLVHAVRDRSTEYAFGLRYEHEVARGDQPRAHAAHVLALAAENSDPVSVTYEVGEADERAEGDGADGGGAQDVGDVRVVERTHSAQLAFTLSVADAVVDASGCAATIAADGAVHVLALGDGGSVTLSVSKTPCAAMEDRAAVVAAARGDGTRTFEYAVAVNPEPASLYAMLVALPARIELLRQTVLESDADVRPVLLLPGALRDNSAVARVVAAVWPSSLPVEWVGSGGDGGSDGDGGAGTGEFVRVRHLLVADWASRAFALLNPRVRWHEYSEAERAALPGVLDEAAVRPELTSCAVTGTPPAELVQGAREALVREFGACSATETGRRAPSIVYVQAAKAPVLHEEVLLAALRAVGELRVVSAAEVDVHSGDSGDALAAAAAAVRCADVLVARTSPALALALLLPHGAALVELPDPEPLRYDGARLAAALGLIHWEVPAAAAAHRARLVVDADVADAVQQAVRRATEAARTVRSGGHADLPSPSRSLEAQAPLEAHVRFTDGVEVQHLPAIVASYASAERALVDRVLRESGISAGVRRAVAVADRTGSVLARADACAVLGDHCYGMGPRAADCTEAARACWRIALTQLTQAKRPEDTAPHEPRWAVAHVLDRARRQFASTSSASTRAAPPTLARLLDAGMADRECVAPGEVEAAVGEPLREGPSMATRARAWSGATVLHCLEVAATSDPAQREWLLQTCWGEVERDPAVAPPERFFGQLSAAMARVRCFLDVFRDRACAQRTLDKAELAADLEAVLRAAPLSLAIGVLPQLSLYAADAGRSIAQDAALPFPFRHFAASQAYMLAEQYEEAADHSMMIEDRYQDAANRLWQVYCLITANAIEKALPLFPRIKALPFQPYDRTKKLDTQHQLAKYLRDRLVLWEELDAPHNASFTPPPRAPLRPSERRYFLSVCTVFRDEGAYLEEWIEYHRMLGVDHFFLTQHNSTVGDPWPSILSPYLDAGIVTLETAARRGERLQVRTAERCVEAYGEYTDWMAFIDVDEFLVPKQDEDLRALLSRYQDANGLFVSERPMAGFPHVEQPATGSLVTEVYRHAMSDVLLLTPFGKTVLNMRNAPLRNATFGDEFGGFYHNPLPEDAPLVDEWGMPVNNRWYLAPPTRALVQYNHYQSKSVEECRRKLERGYAWYEARFRAVGLLSRDEWPDWARRKTSAEICEQNFRNALPAVDGPIDRFVGPLRERLAHPLRERPELPPRLGEDSHAGDSASAA